MRGYRLGIRLIRNCVGGSGDYGGESERADNLFHVSPLLAVGMIVLSG